MSASLQRLSSDQPDIRLGGDSPHLRIHAINVFVRDQSVSLKFYLDQLGFNLVGDLRLGNGERLVAVAPPDGSTVLSLVAAKPGSREYDFVGRATHVVFVTEDLLGKFNEWRSRGVHFQYTPRLKRLTYERPAVAKTGSGRGAETGTGTFAFVADSHSVPQADPEPVWGGSITHFKDPDGNIFALVSYDEESRAVEAHRRATAAKLESERRTAQELEIAKQVQSRLFPQVQPAVETLEYFGVCLQARQIGGDYYDFLELGPQRLGLVVADISGKGIAAALLMANLQANLRSQCAIASDEPERFLRSVNRSFYDNSTESAYATLFFAEYDDRSRRLRYANCGHLAGLLLRQDGAVERLDSTCTVLGMFPIWDCLTQEHAFECGDVLALYTDGLTEACNDAGEEFGEQRALDLLQFHRTRCPADMVRSILDEVKTFSPHEQSDDITVIVGKCR
jgi:serine phosphatase RsbU (regulator of sigma subunit)